MKRKISLFTSINADFEVPSLRKIPVRYGETSIRCCSPCQLAAKPLTPPTPFSWKLAMDCEAMLFKLTTSVRSRHLQAVFCWSFHPSCPTRDGRWHRWKLPLQSKDRSFMGNKWEKYLPWIQSSFSPLAALYVPGNSSPVAYCYNNPTSLSSTPFWHAWDPSWPWWYGERSTTSQIYRNHCHPQWH